MIENWGNKNDRLGAEERRKQKSERNEPSLLKFQKKIVTDDIFGLLWVRRRLKRIKHRIKKLITILLTAIAIYSYQPYSVSGEVAFMPYYQVDQKHEVKAVRYRFICITDHAAHAATHKVLLHHCASRLNIG